MSGIQRALVFKMGVAFATALTFSGLFAATGNPYVANAAWALLALLPLEKRVRGAEPVDERDRDILTRASLFAYGLFWLCFVLGCVLVTVLSSEDATVPTAYLGFLPLAGYWLLEVARSAAGLVIYARGT